MRYDCGCGEGHLRPGWRGNEPVLVCSMRCGEVIEPDPNHPDADPGSEWHTTALAFWSPGTGDPEEDAGESDTLDETPEENMARIEAELGFRPLPAGPKEYR